MSEPTYIPDAKVKTFLDQGIDIRGVLHAGTNWGEEVGYYRKAGIKKFLGFEPLPEAYQQFVRLWGLTEDYRCYNIALGAEEGLRNVRQISLDPPESWKVTGGAEVRHDTGGSSILDHVNPGQWPNQCDVLVLCKPLWYFYKEQEGIIDPKDYNCLVIDVQGMELDVLKGMSVALEAGKKPINYLDNFTCAVIECSETPIFKGEANADEVIAFMEAQGFKRISEITPHDDILFLRS